MPSAKRSGNFRQPYCILVTTLLQNGQITSSSKVSFKIWLFIKTKEQKKKYKMKVKKAQIERESGNIYL